MIVMATNLTYVLASLLLDPRANYLQQRPPRSPQEIARALAPYNLDPNTPLLERWWRWITGVVGHWNWGTSPVGDSVNIQIAARVSVSAQLVLFSLILSTVIGVSLGVYTASRQYRLADRFHQALSVIALNIPVVVAALAAVVLAIALKQRLGTTLLYVAGTQSPTVSGFWPLLIDRIQHLVLPTIVLTATSYAGNHLLQRTLLLDTINSDYVRMARAKGLTRRQAIRRHGLRTCLIPVATYVAFAMPAVFTGSVIIEKIFAWQGMGDYFMQTISNNDVHGTVAVAAFGALMTAVGAILADIVAVALDPRVRASRA
ncbi:ABC transporter permease [Kutzneria sp. CA-103260]|uniref:ABC transporter permease n=1 Tax=Kutzneria sp. CA-103260 TaxID=2802641 RepID=UPI001BA723BA|nr:ABC transporter permease [Kutzneria sp. CA-103260]QUQ68275.1 ABC transporter permease [Kutzneria sp. CA-103260]